MAILSKSHQKLSQKISKWGFMVSDEMAFPPYTVDIYIDQYHLAVECDKHWTHKIKSGKEKDAERRGHLLETYGLPVLSVEDSSKLNLKRITDYISMWADDVEERRQKYIEAYCKL